MPGAFRYEGYAIVSADGMIADADGRMPPALQNPADQRFLSEALDRAAVLVHGRHSHEGHRNSSRRRRVVLSRRAAAIAADPEAPHSVLWNPAGAPFSAACEALGIAGGTAAILGGPEVYALFLELGYERFLLSRAAELKLPGRPADLRPRPASGRRSARGGGLDAGTSRAGSTARRGSR